MATKQVQATLSTNVSRIRLDVTNQQVHLAGLLTVSNNLGDPIVLQEWQENVTPLLDADDILAVARLVTRAQAWVDSKMP